jgi:hypothetical protein
MSEAVGAPPTGSDTTVGEKILAGIVLAACAVMLVRLMLGERRRYRFDAAMRRAYAACRRSVMSIPRWRAKKRDAARAAEEAIKRAREATERDGNVYKPKSFRGPRKPH